MWGIVLRFMESWLENRLQGLRIILNRKLQWQINQLNKDNKLVWHLILREAKALLQLLQILAALVAMSIKQQEQQQQQSHIIIITILYHSLIIRCRHSSLQLLKDFYLKWHQMLIDHLQINKLFQIKIH